MNKPQLKICLLLATLVFALTGCVSNIPVNYAPSSTMSATGSVTVKPFTYDPASTGKIKPNQIRNTALGNVLFEQNIDVLYRDAVFKELRFMGVKMEDASRELSGEIQEFLIDDLGYSIDWTLRVKYTVKVNGAVTYEGVKEIKKKSSKFANPLGSLNETIKLNVEELVKDSAFLQAIK